LSGKVGVGWQDVVVSKRGVRPSRLLLFVALVVVGFAATGCVRVHAAFAVSADDRVSGDVVVASLPNAQSGGTTLSVAPSLGGQVTVTPYKADGYVGSELTFQNLTFDQISLLAATATNQGNAYHISFQRNGDVVDLDGSADLTQVPNDRVDVQVKISFPAPVLRTDGAISGQTVSWQLKPGHVTGCSAADQYVIGNTKGWRFWAFVVGGGGLAASVLVLGLALIARRWHLRKERAWSTPTA
jgi:hypothetical protein